MRIKAELIKLNKIPFCNIALNKVFFLKIIIVPSIFFLCVITSNAQKTNICQQASNIVKTVEKYHFKPRSVNDEFSELVFSSFINRLDPNGLYFSIFEIEQLEKAKYAIDEEIIERKCSFLYQATELYENKLLFTDSLLNSFKTREFDFNFADTISFTENTVFLNNQQLIGKWEKIIKLQVLSSFFANIDSTEANKYSLQEKLLELKNMAIARELCRIKSKINYSSGIEEYVGSSFLKSVASAFDPHTNYFTQSEEQAFSGSLSKEVYSFGFDFSRNDFGEIEIQQIIPGSPSWNSNALNKGDVIISVKASGFDKSFDCININEVVNFLSSDEIMEAEFLIRKKNGKEIKLTLSKDEINVQENVIKSFLLQGKEEIGYICLPSFYSQFDQNEYSYNGCANDVAKELIKLKKEGINGLIIDLRNNSGGSMMEAILMSGIFVDYGAVSIIQLRDEAPVTLKDVNRGTIYNAPLIILINKYSASASELFAASMQDLNRAVIVGSNSFGKSTMQEIVPVDVYKFDKTENYIGKPHGFLKLTRGAFYRVTGKTHQMHGVIPDIKLPSIFEDFEKGEMSYPSALELLSIEKKTYYYPLTPQPVQELNELHNERLKNDNVFSDVENISKLVSDQQNQYSIPLNMESFKKFIQVEETKVLPEKQSTFLVKNPNYFEGFSSNIDSNNELNENSIIQIEKDIYIGEAYNIIIDIINLNKK